jgi:hypothetical protein
MRLGTTRPAQALACEAVQHRAKIPIEIAIDGRRVRSETLASSVGAYVLVLDTTLADHGIDLHSTYTGHAKTKTQATHLILTPDHQESIGVEHEHDAIPVMHARRRCLYDHLHQLQDLLQQDGAEASIPIEDAAIHAIEH